MAEQVEEVIGESEEISTVDAALATMPMIRLRTAAPKNRNGLEDWQTVVLNAGDNWTETVQLPACDENGAPYYYWAEETAVPGYSVSYRFTDGDSQTMYCINAAEPGDGEITVMNTKNESDSVTLPETGSTGTKAWYIAGGVMLLVSAAGYLLYRRRRWLNDR